MTTSEISSALPDVATATLYRHVAVLADAGMLEVASERQARGAVERAYRLVVAASQIGEEEAAHMSVSKYRDSFSAFAGALVAQFADYLDAASAGVGKDTVTFRQIPLWVTDDELESLVDGFSALLAPFATENPDDGRRRHALSVVLHPTH